MELSLKASTRQVLVEMTLINYSHICVSLDHPRHRISEDQPIPGTSLERVSVRLKLSRAYER